MAKFFEFINFERYFKETIRSSNVDHIMYLSFNLRFGDILCHLASMSDCPISLTNIQSKIIFRIDQFLTIFLIVIIEEHLFQIRSTKLDPLLFPLILIRPIFTNSKELCILLNNHYLS